MKRRMSEIEMAQQCAKLPSFAATRRPVLRAAVAALRAVRW